MRINHKHTHVTTALGFFSTAYTRTFRSALFAAVKEAKTKGPRPAPKTITILKENKHDLAFTSKM